MKLFELKDEERLHSKRHLINSGPVLAVTVYSHIGVGGVDILNTNGMNGYEKDEIAIPDCGGIIVEFADGSEMECSVSEWGSIQWRTP